jgi:hypothetical protein
VSTHCKALQQKVCTATGNEEIIVPSTDFGHFRCDTSELARVSASEFDADDTGMGRDA